MKTVEIKLYRFDELHTTYKHRASIEFDESFIKSVVMSIDDVWFTFTGLIIPIFNA